uniref:Uncharacterized protein n=1 Tax=Strigamia maritima TaxID=126957 RepID=T1JBG4_STRMM
MDEDMDVSVYSGEDEFVESIKNLNGKHSKCELEFFSFSASDKPDYGLEEIPSLKSTKSKFESYDDELDDEKGVGQVSVKRSESILSKMAKFQVGDNENGHYDDSESDENETTDPDVIKETRKKEKLYASNQDENDEVEFSGMSDLKSQWEKGPEKAWDEERTRETQEELNTLRQTQAKANLKAVYETALQAERSPAKETVLSSEIREIKSIADKWEHGEMLNENEQEKLNHFNKEKEEDLSVFRDSSMNEARNLFKKIDETVSKSGTIVFNKSPSLERNGSKRSVRDQVVAPDTEIIRSTNQKEEIVVDSTNLHEKFKFFENYQDGAQQSERKRFAMTPPRDPQPEQDESDTEVERDPNVVRSCDHEQEIVTDTARKMLNKFRELETQRGEDSMPQGPKPLKRITPPREYTAVYDDERGSSPEPERDPNVVRCSDKIEDVAMIEAEKTRNLRAKFENWANEDDEEEEEVEQENDDYTKSYDYDNGQPSIDTTKNLKAKFEALREETERANTKPKSPKVNRFVFVQTVI